MAKIIRFDEAGDDIDLLPCPFCGCAPVAEHIGNDRTKKRELTIKCSNIDCRATMTNKSIMHTFRWLERVSAESWNTRKTA